MRKNVSKFINTEKSSNRWWFVTGDGRRFIATGFNHTNMRRLRASYNKEYWKDKVQSPEDLYRMMINDIEHLNMNSIGYGFKLDKNAKPFVEKVNFPVPLTWQDTCDFPDVFSPEYEIICDRIAKEKCQHQCDDPFLIGYYLSDCVEWPVLGKASKHLSGNWLDALKSMEPRASGKQAYVTLMKERHNNIFKYNEVYGTQFQSFDDLLEDRNSYLSLPVQADQARRDDAAFLGLLAKRFYHVTCGAIRKYDSNHLILGDILDGNRRIEEEVLQAIKENVDVLSIQYYGFFKDQIENLQLWNKVTGLPILLADSCYSMVTDAMPRPCGPRMKSEEERAYAFEIYAHQALTTPFVLGWFWCGYMDSSLELEGRRQHSGLKDAWGHFHEPLAQTIQKVYKDLEKIVMKI